MRSKCALLAACCVLFLATSLSAQTIQSLVIRDAIVVDGSGGALNPMTQTHAAQ